MAKKEPDQQTDPEETRAQEHVKEIMEKDPTPPPADPINEPDDTTQPPETELTPSAPAMPTDVSPDDELAAINAAAEAAVAEPSVSDAPEETPGPDQSAPEKRHRAVPQRCRQQMRPPSRVMKAKDSW